LGDFDYDDSVREYSTDHPFRHERLVSLVLPMYKYFDLCYEIWEDLCFPSLNALVINHVDDSATGMPELLSLFSRSGCNLRTMIIGDMPSNVFRTLTSIAPLLENLKLAHDYMDHAWMTNPETMFLPLSRVEGEAQLPVPDLSILVIELCAGSFASRPITTDIPQQIYDIVFSRLGKKVPAEFSFTVATLESGEMPGIKMKLDSLFEFFENRFTEITDPRAFEMYSLKFDFKETKS
jgi:hypothetical protein